MKNPQIDILSLFPDAVRTYLDLSILKRAQERSVVSLESSDLRSYAEGNYRAVDDTVFGGSPGMLMRPEVLESALQDQLSRVQGDRSRLLVVYPSPHGVQFGQRIAGELAEWLGSPGASERPSRRLCFVAGRYEGLDARFIEKWVDLELSLGDFVITGGELASWVFTDAIVRLMPGVLGDESSARHDSFSEGLLEHSQYTRPRAWGSQEVPEILFSGNHAEIKKFHLKEALLMTYALRPDLIEKHTGQGLPDWARSLLERLKKRLHLRDLSPLDHSG